MDPNGFDKISKRMAAAATRRGLLKALGAGLAGALLTPAIVRVPAARAQAGCGDAKPCGPRQVCVGTSCIDLDQLGPQCGQGCEPGQTCLARGNTCCDNRLICDGVCYTVAPNQCPGTPSCCSPLESCCPNNPCCKPATETCLPIGCCPNASVCGVECCGADQECLDGSCWPKCATPCASGEICMNSGAPDAGIPQTCCPFSNAWALGGSGPNSRGSCCPPENRWPRLQGSVEIPDCCPEADRWLEQGECCPASRRNGTGAAAYCCKEGTVGGIDESNPPSRTCCQPSFECNGVCCSGFRQCLGGTCQDYRDSPPPAASAQVCVDVTCKPGQTCCIADDKKRHLCCNSGDSCCDGHCCSPGDSCCPDPHDANGGRTCMSPSRLRTDPGNCKGCGIQCGPHQVCNTGECR